MNKWRLPASLVVGGAVFAIRTDYRIVLGILHHLKDDSLPDVAKMSIVLKSLYLDADSIPQENMMEALEKAFWYISGGVEGTSDDTPRPTLVDWEQDADIIISAMNKTLGYDVRGVDMHWWTFLSFFHEIGDSTFTTVVGIRSKMAHGKKLEDYEREYVRDNRDTVIIGAKSEERKRQDEEDRAALAAIGIK